MAEKLLTIRDVSSILGISEKEVIERSEKGEIPAYKVGGVYLRFQKDQVERLTHSSHRRKAATHSGYSVGEQLRDFFYFYDFYILSAILILVLLVIITQS
ncbi:DNA-binding protein [bacterium]|nr:MAG: DNA-binding protein [bacterium]